MAITHFSSKNNKIKIILTGKNLGTAFFQIGIVIAMMIALGFVAARFESFVVVLAIAIIPVLSCVFLIKLFIWNLFGTETIELTKKISAKELLGGLIVSPSGSLPDHLSKSLKNIRSASASGWMMCRGMRRRGNFEKGFVLSDHADWPGLNKAIKLTEAENIYPTHGYTRSFSKWLNEQGYRAQSVDTSFEGESPI